MKQANIDYKVEGGKLLRIELMHKNDHILTIKLCGDFFIHPEYAIEDIEKGLMGVPFDHVSQRLKDIIQTKNIQLIGFSPDDLQKAVKQSS
ncbi:hypothetical protein H6503_05875 [Candidatus Woesearchaeota archaeon]|nr:hypothetical protein [Candidatus Woesearchaeota archaeon]